MAWHGAFPAGISDNPLAARALRATRPAEAVEKPPRNGLKAWVMPLARLYDTHARQHLRWQRNPARKQEDDGGGLPAQF